MDDADPPPPERPRPVTPAAEAARAARLAREAAALRDNLRRRKDHLRARDETPGQPEDTDPVCP